MLYILLTSPVVFAQKRPLTPSDSSIPPLDKGRRSCDQRGHLGEQLKNGKKSDVKKTDDKSKILPLIRGDVKSKAFDRGVDKVDSKTESKIKTDPSAFGSSPNLGEQLSKGKKSEIPPLDKVTEGNARGRRWPKAGGVEKVGAIKKS